MSPNISEPTEFKCVLELSHRRPLWELQRVAFAGSCIIHDRSEPLIQRETLADALNSTPVAMIFQLQQGNALCKATKHFRFAMLPADAPTTIFRGNHCIEAIDEEWNSCPAGDLACEAKVRRRYKTEARAIAFYR